MKYAIIVNGDKEERHLQNVERSLAVLENQGFETYVATPSQPNTTFDHYARANMEGLKTLVNGLSARISDQDELVIYTTGHGKKDGEDGNLCLEDGCNYESIASLLGDLPYRKRTVVMDDCLGGNWGKRFLDNPNTLFISLGNKNEVVACEEFAPRFWGQKIPDLNNDGHINWQERYANAVANRVLSSVPQFVSSIGYVQEGRPSFSMKVREVHDEIGLKNVLAELQPGQYAAVTFSATWCGPCKDYKPVFEQIARDAQGQHLFLRTENEELAKTYGVKGYPTVVVLDYEGKTFRIQNRDRILQELAQFSLPDEEVELLRWRKAIAKAEQTDGKEDRANALAQIAIAMDRDGFRNHRVAVQIAGELIRAVRRADPDYPHHQASVLENIACAFKDAGWKNEATSMFRKAIAAAEKIKDDDGRAEILIHIAISLGGAQLKDKAEVYFLRKLATLAEAIEDDQERANLFRYIGAGLAKAGLKDEALAMLDQAAVEAEKIGKDKLRIFALLRIAYETFRAGYKDGAMGLFDKTIKVASKIEDNTERLLAFYSISNELKRISFGKEGVEADFKAPMLRVCRAVMTATQQINNATPSTHATVLTNIAYILGKLGFSDQAVPLFRQARDTACNIRGEENRLHHFEDMAFALSELNLKDKVPLSINSCPPISDSQREEKGFRLPILRIRLW